MGPTSFTFLNTNGPALSGRDAKVMRAHVSRGNFANRRPRSATAKEREPRTRETTRDQKRKDRTLCTRAPLLPWLPLVAKDMSADMRAQLLRGLRVFVFEDTRVTLENPSEVAWFDLILSEPALIEATWAVGIQCWSPELLYDLKAGVHKSKAISLLYQRIDSGEVSDAVLGAVFTMAFGECLTGNDFAWNVHVDGAAQMIKHRRLQGLDAVPWWISDLIIFDSLNALFGFPRFYHQRILDALGNEAGDAISSMISTSEALVQLSNSVDAYDKDGACSKSVLKQIDESLALLHSHVLALRNDANPWVRATSRAIELLLHLTWPQVPSIDLTILASKLQDDLSRLQIRPCPYMDLTSFHIMLGAIAAKEGSETREWFVARLRKVIRSMKQRGWSDPLSIFEGRITGDARITARFKALWDEVNQST